MDFTDLESGRKFVVIHEDDVGMTHGANAAFVELSALGACSSGSVMPPCPWFPEAVEMAKADPTLDLGVHLTLTSEKKPYRWRPLTSRRGRPASPTQGLFLAGRPERAPRRPESGRGRATRSDRCDSWRGRRRDPSRRAHGHGHVPGIRRHLHPTRARLPLPILLVKDYNIFNPRSYSGPISNDNYNAALARARASGFAVFDLVQETMWDRKEDAETAYGAMFRRLPAGLTFLSLHFNAPGDFEVIEPSHAHIRTDEYALFKSGKIKQWASENQLEIVGMRAMRDDLRARLK